MISNTCIRSAILWCACLTSLPALADVAQLVIEGEAVPSFEEALYVEPIDQSALKRFRHDSIKYITFHHEGFSDRSSAVFEARKSGRSNQTAVERVKNIHNQHVEDGLGMIAYNYAVGPAGEIVRGRPLEFAPGTNSNHPETGKRADFEGHFAIVALADFDFEKVEDRKKQIDSMVKVMSRCTAAVSGTDR